MKDLVFLISYHTENSDQGNTYDMTQFWSSSKYIPWIVHSPSICICGYMKKIHEIRSSGNIDYPRLVECLHIAKLLPS